MRQYTSPYSEEEKLDRATNLLRFIDEFIAEHKYPPTLTEMIGVAPARHGGPGSKSTVSRCLAYLRTMGWIESIPGQYRTVRITDDGHSKLREGVTQ